MNSLNGLNNNSILSNLSGLSTGNFDYVNSGDVSSDTIEANTLTVYGTNISTSLTNLQSQITTLQGQVDGLLLVFSNTGMYYNSTLNAFFISLSDLRVQKTLYLYDSSNNPYSVNSFITNTNSSITSINSSITSINQKLTIITYDSSTTAVVINGDLRVTNIYLYASGSPINLYSFMTTTNNSISSLNTKTTGLSYSGTTTTISGALTLDTSGIDGFNKTNFDNAINFSYGLTSDAQVQLNAITASLTLVGTTATGAAAAGVTNAAAITATNVIVTANTTNIAGNTADITALQNKLTTYTYYNSLNKVSISSVFEANSFNSISLGGGITQTSNIANELIGVTTYKNYVNITNGFGLNISGGSGGINIGGGGALICGTGNSSFGGSLTVSGNTIINSNTTIKDLSTSNSGTIAPYLNIISTNSNSNVRKLQGLIVGVEASPLATQINCNLGYSFYSTTSLNNYGYLGLNVGATPIESFRWFNGGCAIPTGDLTISSGNQIITTGNLQVSSGSVNTNTINNFSTNLVLNSSGTSNIQMNSKNIYIGTNQGTASGNSINIGSVSALSYINLNGIISCPFGFSMSGTGIFSQW